jgi:hypothetical protein
MKIENFGHYDLLNYAKARAQEAKWLEKMKKE